MACYQCNEEGGDETRLCSKCNEERKQNFHKPLPTPEELPPPPLVDSSTILNLSGMVAAICVSMFVICYAPFGPGYGLPLGEQAFRRCESKMAAEAPAQAKQEAKDAKNIEEVEKLTQKLLGKVSVACESVRGACDNSPNSEKCRSVF